MLSFQTYCEWWGGCIPRSWVRMMIFDCFGRTDSGAGEVVREEFGLFQPFNDWEGVCQGRHLNRRHLKLLRENGFLCSWNSFLRNRAFSALQLLGRSRHRPLVEKERPWNAPRKRFRWSYSWETGLFQPVNGWEGVNQYRQWNIGALDCSKIVSLEDKNEYQYSGLL